ncbi:MAG: glycosyltransferase family 1 protein [Lacibacter sp.]
MKIAVNTRLLRKNKMDGIGWFTYNTLKYIVQKNPQIEFHFLFDSEIDESFIFGENVHSHVLFPPAKHALLNIIWFEWSVKRFLNKEKPDLFFSPDGILCLGWKGKQFGVIHDINFLHKPKDLKFSNRKYYNYFFPKYAKKAAGIATVSAYSKQDICSSYTIDENKVDVVYCGVNSFYHPVDAATVELTRRQFADGQPYFVFVGTLSPRKNVLGLMKAFDLYKKESGDKMKLLIVGWSMYKTDELVELKQQLQFGSDIIFTGRLGDDELNNVLASALCLVFVPFFEGFGIPVIEAMQCNVPVIASNVTSVPEVTGDAAILVDPENTTEIKDAMIRVVNDHELRLSLIEKGKQRKALFTWEKTAELLWQSISRIL